MAIFDSRSSNSALIFFKQHRNLINISVLKPVFDDSQLTSPYFHGNLSTHMPTSSEIRVAHTYQKKVECLPPPPRKKQTQVQARKKDERKSKNKNACLFSKNSAICFIFVFYLSDYILLSVADLRVSSVSSYRRGPLISGPHQVNQGATYKGKGAPAHQEPNV